jgi:DNA-directed RNA polymerase omega subunit
MPYQPLEKLLPKTKGSIFKLVILSSQRALELAEGMPAFVNNPNSDKPTVLSLDEIAQEKVGMQLSQGKPKAKPEEPPKETKQEPAKEKAQEKPAAKAKKKSK